jgi:hypothetical protein
MSVPIRTHIHDRFGRVSWSNKSAPCPVCTLQKLQSAVETELQLQKKSAQGNHPQAVDGNLPHRRKQQGGPGP